MYMYMYMYLYMYMYMYVCICMYVYVYVYVYVYTYACMHACMHVCMCIYVYPFWDFGYAFDSRAVAQRHFINLGTAFPIKCVVTPSMHHAKRRVLEDAD